MRKIETKRSKKRSLKRSNRVNTVNSRVVPRGGVRL